MNNTLPTLIERYWMSLTKLAQACAPSMKMLSESMVNFMERLYNMKDFDYNAARAGAPVCTRSGRPARIICWDANAKWDDDKLPIVALIEDDIVGEVAQTYTTDGRVLPNKTNDDDLMMATTKREGWIFLYNIKDDKRTSGSVYKTARDAEIAAKEIVSGKDCWLVKIEWEE